MTVRLDGRYAAEQFGDNFETREPSPNGRTGLMPARTVWNVAAGAVVPVTRLRVTATVKNLFDAT